jgi:hypothetical protein
MYAAIVAILFCMHRFERIASRAHRRLASLFGCRRTNAPIWLGLDLYCSDRVDQVFLSRAFFRSHAMLPLCPNGFKNKASDVPAGSFADGSILGRTPTHVAKITDLRAYGLEDHQHPLIDPRLSG